MEDYSAEGAWPVEDLKAYFSGHWTLSRTMNDLKLNMPGAMEGLASFSLAEFEDGLSGLLYHENGELRFGDYREDVNRSYQYIIREPRSADIRFDDRRFFYHLDLTSGRCLMEHQCGDDMYRGRIRVDNEDVWRISWFISGPRKEIVLDTRYHRNV